MRSGRSVLALKYTPVSVAGGLRKAVGGFLRYVQYRDQHQEPKRDGGLDAYVRYVAHRDRTSPAGRVFGAAGRAEVDRKRLVAFVARSTKGLEPQWVKGRDGKLVDRQRAVYQFVLSPEDWRGLDLRRLARVAMAQLEQDAGVGLGPWFAAEHRNTAHHHVHIVLAARREVSPGRFTTVLINRQRLQRMKEAIGHEVTRQRGHERAHGRQAMPKDSPRHLGPAVHRRGVRRTSELRIGMLQAATRTPAALRRGLPRSRGLLQLRGVVLGYRRRIQRELEEELERREREARVR